MLQFSVAVKYSLQISSVLLDYTEKWQLLVVLTEVIFYYNSAKYEAIFIFLFRQILEII